MTAEQSEHIRRAGMEAAGFGPEAMMQRKVCPHCGHMGAASQFFCKECGHRLPRHSLYRRYQEKHRCCPVCGTVAPDAAQYCAQCGKALEESAV